MKILTKHRWLLRLLLAFMVILNVSTVTTIASRAEDPVPATDPLSGDGTYTREAVYDDLGKKAGGIIGFAINLFFDIKENMDFNDLVDRLKVTDDEIGWANRIWEILAPLGVFFAIIYFLMDMDRAVFTAGSSWSIQQLAGPMLKFGACMLVLEQGGRIVGAVCGLGNQFIDLSNGLLTSSTGAGAYSCSQDVYDFFKNMGIIQAVIFILFLALTWIVDLIVKFMFMYKTIVYKIELILRLGITSAILGDFWEGKHSAAVRWLKKLFGHFMYGGAFLLILYIGHELAETSVVSALTAGGGGALGTTTNNVFSMLCLLIYGMAVPIAQIGVLGAAKQACAEIMQ